MSFEVEWTKEAEITFNLNVEYLAKDWDSSITLNFLDRVDEVISTLQTNPKLYPVYGENEDIHRCFLNKHLLLIYKIVNDSRVDLITFWNTHQNPERLELPD